MKKKVWSIAVASIIVLSITGTVLAVQPGQLIGKEKAKEAALAAQAGRVDDIELDHIQGKPVYEVEIKNVGKEVEVKVDATTGDVLEVVQDKERVAQDKETNRITKEEAIQIALQIVKGKVVEVDLDEDDSFPVYEIEIKNDEIEAEIEIDAIGGKVLSKDFDRVDDDDDDDDYDND